MKSTVDVPELEHEVERKFGVDMVGKLQALEEPIRLSKAEYDRVLVALRTEDAFTRLMQIMDQRPDVHQALSTTDFPALFEQAGRAQALLVREFASEWTVIEREGEHMRRPKMETLSDWLCGSLHDAVDPGVKGEVRAKEKLKNDYGGDVSCLKDLSRLTLVCNTPSDLVFVFEGMLKRFEVVSVKNKFTSPTPLGYCDINLGIRLRLAANGENHICEVQLNLPSVLEAKHRAHQHYSVVRALLPGVCKDAGVDPDELEAFLVQRLSASSADGVTELLVEKSQGLFMHVRHDR